MGNLFVENHLFYVEHWFHSVFWNKMREVAAILKEHGLIKDIEDIWLLRRDEIKQALWDVVTASPASRRAAASPVRRKSNGARVSWNNSASGALRQPSA